MPTRRNNIYKEGLDKLIEWVRNKNWEVYLGHYTNEMSSYDRIITISNRFKIENQLYACLHECGHLLLHKNKRYSKMYPHAFKIDRLPSKNKRLFASTKYRVDEIAEELDAWRKGKLLAKRLNIYINEENYNNEMSRCVFTYIKEAGK